MISDESYMQYALTLAQQAADTGEVPVGAVIVLNGQIIGRGFNQSIALHDPSSHAEIMALRDAAKNIANYRLIDSTLYVTLEPCMMCIGAIVHARIRRVVFGAYDPKTGAVASVAELFKAPYLNHQVEVSGGVLAGPCGEMLRTFFKSRR
jgi:tRNA(adenine34) deaminase